MKSLRRRRIRRRRRKEEKKKEKKKKKKKKEEEEEEKEGTKGNLHRPSHRSNLTPDKGQFPPHFCLI